MKFPDSDGLRRFSLLFIADIPLLFRLCWFTVFSESHFKLCFGCWVSLTSFGTVSSIFLCISAFHSFYLKLDAGMSVCVQEVLSSHQERFLVCHSPQFSVDAYIRDNRSCFDRLCFLASHVAGLVPLYSPVSRITAEAVWHKQWGAR